MNRSFQVGFGLLLTGWVLALSGCGNGVNFTQITGRIVQDGKPITFSSGGPPGASYVEISFRPADTPAIIAASGKAQDDGSFTLEADADKFKPGKYKVVVHAWNPNPDVDKLDGKFSEKNTPIEIEVKGSDVGTIDLAKYK